MPGGGEGVDLVSVVVPAYNAAATIGETLESVSAQTYPDLEIIVVDDGSTDGTPELVLSHRARDPRVTLLRQRNAGVAAARNAGLATARGAYVAPIDADDLWRPDKIRRQVAAMRRGGGSAGLCCTGVCFLDEAGNILATTVPDGGDDPFRAMCRNNIVTNGSAALMPRDLVLAKGGFDAGLRAAKAQGCEDWKLYLGLVETHDLVVVPDLLTGYRQYPGQMSGDLMQMIRSAERVLGEVATRVPSAAGDVQDGLRNFRLYMAGRALTEHRYGTAIALAAAVSPTDGLRFAGRCARRFIGRRLGLRREPPRPAGGAARFLGEGPGRATTEPA